MVDIDLIHNSVTLAWQPLVLRNCIAVNGVTCLLATSKVPHSLLETPIFGVGPTD